MCSPPTASLATGTLLQKQAEGARSELSHIPLVIYSKTNIPSPILKTSYQSSLPHLLPAISTDGTSMFAPQLQFI